MSLPVHNNGDPADAVVRAAQQQATLFYANRPSHTPGSETTPLGRRLVLGGLAVSAMAALWLALQPAAEHKPPASAPATPSSTWSSGAGPSPFAPLEATSAPPVSRAPEPAPAADPPAAGTPTIGIVEGVPPPAN
jgi:hypothetical protein